MKDILDYVFFGNTVMNYSIAAFGILITWIVLKLIKRKLLVLLKN